jgi:perosamine synthetase
LPVDIFGFPCDIKKILEIGSDAKCVVAEDACEALGAKIGNRHVGSFGNPAVFAFYPNKQMTTGEGGIITTNSASEKDFFDSLRNQGRKKNGGWLEYETLGYNYRLNELSCALGLSQLKRVGTLLKKRENAATEYSRRLSGISGVITPFEKPGITRGWFVYVIRLESGINRDAVLKKLNDSGVECKPYLPSIHLQSFYRKQFGFKPGDFPICEAVSASTIALPFFTDISKIQIERVCCGLEKAICEVSK